jgi:hypothetical protein
LFDDGVVQEGVDQVLDGVVVKLSLQKIEVGDRNGLQTGHPQSLDLLPDIFAPNIAEICSRGNFNAVNHGQVLPHCQNIGYLIYDLRFWIDDLRNPS